MDNSSTSLQVTLSNLPCNLTESQESVLLNPTVASNQPKEVSPLNTSASSILNTSNTSMTGDMKETGHASSTKQFSLASLLDVSMLPSNFGGSGASIQMDQSLFLKSAEVFNHVLPGLSIPGYNAPTSSNTSTATQPTNNTNTTNVPINSTPINSTEQTQMVQFDSNSGAIQKVGEEKTGAFINVTPYLTLPQHAAAKKMGIPSSTLSKRWKEASCSRKWPFRTVSKLDKEILTLLKNVENASSSLAPHVEETLGILLKRRQEELRTVIIRI